MKLLFLVMFLLFLLLLIGDAGKDKTSEEYSLFNHLKDNLGKIRKKLKERNKKVKKEKKIPKRG